MNWKRVLAPNNAKVVVVFAVMTLVLLFFQTAGCKQSKECKSDDLSCKKEVAGAFSRCLLISVWLVGLPLSLVAYLATGIIETRIKR